MKKLLYIGLLAFGLCTTSACLKDFQQLNTNPEDLGNTSPANVFTGATENFNNCSRAHLTGQYATVMQYMQYLVPSSGPSAGVYVSEANKNSHPQAYAPAYNDYYTNFGRKLYNLITVTIPSQENKDAWEDVANIAKILLTYKQWQVLDTYGAAPITEGLKGQSEGIEKPRYDLYQKGINGEPMYKVFDAQIKEAVKGLKDSKNQQSLGNNDFFYKGDTKKWVKFANTLRVKMAQRLEKADPAFYNSVVEELLLGADVNIISSLQESCIYQHPNDYNNNTDDIQDITSRYIASAAFINFLRINNDPRLKIMARYNSFGPNNNNKVNDETFALLEKHYPDYKQSYAQFVPRYVGITANPAKAAEEFVKDGVILPLKYTNDQGAEAVFNIRIYSQVESRYYVKNGGINGNNNMPAQCIEDVKYMIDQDKMHSFTPILTYSETCLMLAEIAIKKGSAVAGKTATEWFKEGIEASIKQYRQWANNMYVVSQTAQDAPTYSPLTDEEINTYLSQPQFSSASLEKIISQQWINLFMQPYEMWATWKRTSLPAFNSNGEAQEGVAHFENIFDGEDNVLLIPRRNILPVPNVLNIDNYNAAIEALKADTSYGTDADQTQGRIWWDKE